MTHRGPAPLLLQRDFAALWWGQLISILGERLNYVALVGIVALHTDQLRDSNASLLLSALGNAMVAPVLLFSPFTGVWLDRSNIKHVLVLSDLVRSLLVLLLPVLYAATHSMGPVLGLVFLLFTCNVLFLPAKSAITPEILEPSQLLAANSLLSLAGVAATLLGALVGGWIVDHWGWQTALYVNAATYLVSVVSLALIRYRPRPHEARPGITLRRYLGEVAEGWKLVRRRATIGVALASLGAVWVGGGILHVAGNPHIQRAASQPGMERLGVLLGCLAAGAVVATLWLNGPGRAVPRGPLLAVGLTLAGAALAAFAVSTRFAVFAASGFVIGVCAAPIFVLSETLLQEDVPLERRGRVFSLRDFLMRLVFLVGMSFAGVAVAPLGTRPVLLVCAGLMVGLGGLVFAWGRRPRAAPSL
jgi:MFS family permease